MNGNDSLLLFCAIFIFIGSIMALVSAIGIVRFNDIYTRSHAATKSSTLAVLLTLLGVFFYFIVQDGYVSYRLLLGILFLYITSPVAGHLITRAAFTNGVKMHTNSAGKKGKYLNQLDISKEKKVK